MIAIGDTYEVTNYGNLLSTYFNVGLEQSHSNNKKVMVKNIGENAWLFLSQYFIINIKR